MASKNAHKDSSNLYEELVYPFIYQDSGAMVQLAKALLSAPISLFWDKNSQFLMEPKVNLQILEIFGWKVCKYT